MDPGVVLLDIAFTGNDANHGMPSSISIFVLRSPKQASCMHGQNIDDTCKPLSQTGFN